VAVIYLAAAALSNYCELLLHIVWWFTRKEDLMMSRLSLPSNRVCMHFLHFLGESNGVLESFSFLLLDGEVLFH